MLFTRNPQRFWVLTPAILRKQVIYDRKNRKLIRVKIRDSIDFAVIKQIFLWEDYGLGKLPRAVELDERYRAIVASGRVPLIIDCGANSGMASRYFAETYKDAFVVAIEPDAGNLELARSNNLSRRVSFRLAGIGNSDTRANIKDPGKGNWAYRVEEEAEGNVALVSMNSLLRDFNTDLYVPFIVKIDIEGFEANLFEKNTEWMDRFPVLMIELHDWMLPGQGSSSSFLRQVAARNRDFVFFGENVFSISNSLPPQKTESAESQQGLVVPPAPLPAGVTTVLFLSHETSPETTAGLCASSPHRRRGSNGTLASGRFQ